MQGVWLDKSHFFDYLARCCFWEGTVRKASKRIQIENDKAFFRALVHGIAAHIAAGLPIDLRIHADRSMTVTPSKKLSGRRNPNKELEVLMEIFMAANDRWDAVMEPIKIAYLKTRRKKA